MTSPSYDNFGPSVYSKGDEVVLVGWNSQDGIARLARSSHKQDFYRLAHVFQPQINPVYCGIASAVIVLNGFRMPGGRAPSQSELEVVRPEELGGGVSTFTSYSQLTLLDEKSDLVKPREVINMTRVADPDSGGAGQFDGGVSIADLGAILELYGANATVTYADQDVGIGAAVFRDVAMAVLDDETSFLIVNFLGSAIGTATGGHISPLGAYDEQSDSILVLDVAGHKTPWYWATLSHLYQAMHTLAGDAYRGWLVISDS
jgi:hypothetical protein